MLLFKLFVLDEDPNETSDEVAEEEVEQAEEDVKNGDDRRAMEALICFRFNINREDGDKVGEIGAEDEDCPFISSGLASSSVAGPVVGIIVGAVVKELALDDDLRGFSDFRKRCTVAVEGPKMWLLVLLLLPLLCGDNRASAPLM